MNRQIQWQFPCVPACRKGGSSSARGLSLHQASCRYSLEQDWLHSLDISCKHKKAKISHDAAVMQLRTRHSRSIVIGAPSAPSPPPVNTHAIDDSLPDPIPEVPEPLVLG